MDTIAQAGELFAGTVYSAGRPPGELALARVVGWRVSDRQGQPLTTPAPVLVWLLPTGAIAEQDDAIWTGLGRFLYLAGSPQEALDLAAAGALRHATRNEDGDGPSDLDAAALLAAAGEALAAEKRVLDLPGGLNHVANPLAVATLWLGQRLAAEAVRRADSDAPPDLRLTLKRGDLPPRTCVVLPDDETPLPAHLRPAVVVARGDNGPLLLVTDRSDGGRVKYAQVAYEAAA